MTRTPDFPHGTGAALVVLMKLAMLALVFSTTGCSVIGAGIGAAIPKYANVSDLQPSVGQSVKLSDADGHTLASGTLKGYDSGDLLVDEGGHEKTVPIDNVAKAKRKIGSYWEIGGAIGLLVDVTAFIVAVEAYTLVAAQHTSASHWGWGGFGSGEL